MGRRLEVLGRDPSVCERLGVVAMFRCFDRTKIEAAVTAADHRDGRRRELPAELTIYYVIAMSLFRHVNLKEVLRCLLEGWRSVRGTAPIKITGKSGISQARSRLGAAPVEHLYRSCVQPIAVKDTKGAWYQDWRLVSLDGSTLDLPDECANRRHFGGPTTYNDKSPFPQLRFATLAEIGTHVLFGAEMDDYATSEVALAKRVIDHLAPGMLCLADRGFFGFELWRQAHEKGADLLWRAPKSAVLPIDKALPDGSYLSHLTTSRQRSLKNPPPGLPVRVVEYRIDGVDKEPTVYRLITTILDHDRAPAIDLAGLYHQRWEIETAFDEFKTHLRGAGLSLRSKTPDLVRQEFFGMMLAHFAVRGLMHEAALKADEDPDNLSFVHSLNVIRRKASLASAIPPSI